MRRVPFLQGVPTKRRHVVQTPAAPPTPKDVTDGTTSTMTPDSRKFINKYYQRYSRPMYDAGKTRNLLYKEHNTENTKLEANVTLLEGGNFYVPFEAMHLYHLYHAVDTLSKDNRAFIGLNERSVGCQFVALALELDYRFNDIRQDYSMEAYQKHIDIIIGAISPYYITDERNTMRCMVFMNQLKPKKKGKTWRFARGMHLIFNRQVGMEEGAQLSHAAAVALTSYDSKLKGVVDNIYLEPNGASYKKIVSLRPPYSCKKVPCYYCNDHSIKDTTQVNYVVTKSSREIVRETKRIPESSQLKCSRCKGYGSVLDANWYSLYRVYGMDGQVLTKEYDELMNNLEDLLAKASIWGRRSPMIPIHWPEKEPKYSLYEMVEFNSPDIAHYDPHKSEEQKEAHRAAQKTMGKDHTGNKVNVRKQLTSFGFLRVKARDEKGMVLPRISHLESAIERMLGSHNGNYSSISVSKLTMYRNGEALSVGITGPGSTYCMVQDAYHNSNRASVWMVMDNNGARFHMGCYSRNCESKFITVEPQDTAEFQEVMRMARDALQSVDNRAKMTQYKKQIKQQ